MLDGVLILAAGEGSRMAPFSEQVPKPFFNIDGKPLIQHVIDYTHHHFRSVVPTVVSAQSKHLHWFEKIKGISSIIVNNTPSNYYPCLHLKGRWMVLCADLLLKMEEDWQGMVDYWVGQKTAAAVCPMLRPQNSQRKGDQLSQYGNNEFRRWKFEDQGDYLLSGISFIDTSHSHVENVHYGGFIEAWKMLHQVNHLSFLPIRNEGWHTFDTIREIADYEDNKLKKLCEQVHTDLRSTLRGYLGGYNDEVRSN